MPWIMFWTILLQVLITLIVLTFPTALLVGTIVGAWTKNGGGQKLQGPVGPVGPPGASGPQGPMGPAGSMPYYPMPATGSTGPWITN